MQNQTSNIPAHIAIIMDGNGRWAKKRGLPRIAGHKKGTEILHEIMQTCQDLGVSYLTIYAFSAENWQRPASEVGALMDLLQLYIKHEIGNLHKKGVRLKIIGDLSKVEPAIAKQIAKAEELTKDNRKFFLNVALSYGARQEISHAARSIVEKVIDGEIDIENIDENLLGAMLYTKEIPDPDLLIRTGGEQRLSNFLLWQAAYSELYFTDVLWPDFTGEHLKAAVAEYSQRERRYGKTD
ncbi:MAG: isoprenyl transferase [Pseudomonadota bacterium]